MGTDTRDQILDAAEKVIARRGLAGLTTREIAREAGLAEGTLYKHFAGKTDLCLTVLAERVPEFFALLSELPNRAGERTVRRNLEEVGRGAIPFFLQVVPMTASLFSHPKLMEEHRNRLHERRGGPHLAVRALTEYVHAEQRLGRVTRSVDPLSVAAVLLGCCHNYAYISHFLRETSPLPDAEKYVKQVVKLMAVGFESGRRSDGK